VWEKLPQPVFQTDQATVVVMDLSLSMNSSDLKPSRMERARFKVSDILAKQQEGVIGLVVFAGDAFVVSPLTRDGETISAMLPALKPDIMPVQGSRADLGLLKAAELLKQAGRMRGEVLLQPNSCGNRE
jgi:Ca-activated chloride channel family protein